MTICRSISAFLTAEKKSGGGKRTGRVAESYVALNDGQLDGKRLMFVDEMGTHTSLAPSYAYAPRGKRAFFKVPRNRGKNVTLLASIGYEGMGPSMPSRASPPRRSSRPTWNTF